LVDLSLAMIEHINEELEPIGEQLRSYALALKLVARRLWSIMVLGSLPA
jgi:hypothetical protein